MATADQPGNHAHAHHHPAHHSQPPHLAETATEQDPVCGMPVAGDSPLHASHGGRDYHFCSQRCLDRFVAEPQRYAGAEPAAAPVEADPAAEYTCPMHPEIRQ
ncbi:MAG TPA: copper-transporting ATPase, partial [Pseudomonas sp.]|nr:copper-transporting ATPase [Pseudomonas sp.]